MSRGRSTLLVTRLPLLTTAHITAFESKSDVVAVAAASAHLPLVFDGSWCERGHRAVTRAKKSFRSRGSAPVTSFQD
jgi:hypothetical protein